MIPVTNDEELDRIDSIYYLLRPLLIDFEGESLTATYSEMLNMAKLTFKFEAQGKYLLSVLSDCFYSILLDNQANLLLCSQRRQGSCLFDDSSTH